MIFPQDPKIDIGTDGFAGKDLLGRTEFGQRLTDLVDRIEQPLVIALDGEWGSGKSHFLKLWTGAHKKELGGKAEVIYFDAFEHDFLDDPLVSLIGRLADDAAPRTWSAAAVEKLKKSAFPLVKIVSRVGLAVATFGATEMAKPAVDVAIAKISETTDEAIGQFWENEASRIKAMQGFRAALESLTKNADGTTQKIVFIIDELDRCRPDYALQMLEIIKHFFAVPNVHFVLGANLRELENSVKARYGADINARKYLQKFIHLQMELSNKTTNGDSHAIKLFKVGCAQLDMPNDYGATIASRLALIEVSSPVTLRDAQRLLMNFALVPPRLHQAHNWIWLSCISALFMKVLSPRKYQMLRSGSLVFQDIEEFFSLSNYSGDEKYFVEQLTELWKALLTDGFHVTNPNSDYASLNIAHRPERARKLEQALAKYLDVFNFPDDPTP